MIVFILTQIFGIVSIGAALICAIISILLMRTSLWKQYVSDYCRRYLTAIGVSILGYILALMPIATSSIKVYLGFLLCTLPPFVLIMLVYYYVFICPPNTAYTDYMRKQFKKQK